MAAISIKRSLVVNLISAAKSIVVMVCILALSIPAMGDRRRNNPDVYVGNVNGNSVSVIDSRNNKVVATIKNIFFSLHCGHLSGRQVSLYRARQWWRDGD